MYALTAASLPKSHAALVHQRALKSISTHASPTTKIHEVPPPRLGASVQASSDALQYVKSAWVAQDEAQDALYFHHDGLWKARGHCHDVLGAMCVLSTPGVGEKVGADDDAMELDGSKKDATTLSFRGGGRWPDFPTDVALAVDRYEISKEKSYSPSELQARLSSAVRRKLVLGEVGTCGTSVKGLGKEEAPLPWRVVIERGGGCIRLTHGAPRMVSTAEALADSIINNNSSESDVNLQQYPMEARLSVLSESSSAPWKLLSLHIQCSPKTGESDHQLGMNKKQMFDLHRIGERAMIVEEAICKKLNDGLKDANKEKDSMEVNGNEQVLVSSPVVPRPLLRLFEVAHTFALSLQLEMLSSQAEALRRGAWGGVVNANTSSAGGRGSALKDTLGDGIAVSPAYFFDGGNSSVVNKTKDEERDYPIAVMAVHFWSCDDRYGSPKVGDLSVKSEEKETKSKEMDEASSVSTCRVNIGQRMDDNYIPKSDRRGEKRLSLCIRAVPTVGLLVSLSGGLEESTLSHSHHVQQNVGKLISSIQDPFQLSMSDALLAATVLCAERRCQAVVAALNRQQTSTIPSWIRLEVECGSISVAAKISYLKSKTKNDKKESERLPVVLFRLACDSRTGRFVPVFPRTASLLRLLACNDPAASDIQSLHSASVSSAVRSRSGGAGANVIGGKVDGATREATGRIVRDAFDALARSMDTLGRRCGVGGTWNDVDDRSSSLRVKSVDQACGDVRVSLVLCCGLSAVFGVAAIALKIVGGVDPVADMAGGLIEDESNAGLIRVPPLSVVLRQRIIEKEVKEGDGETKRISQLEGELFAVSAKTSDYSLDIVCFDVLTLTESASAVPMRLKYAQTYFPDDQSEPKESSSVSRPTKRSRTCRQTLDEVEYASTCIDKILNQ